MKTVYELFDNPFVGYTWKAVEMTRYISDVSNATIFIKSAVFQEYQTEYKKIIYLIYSIHKFYYILSWIYIDFYELKENVVRNTFGLNSLNISEILWFLVLIIS